MRRMKRRALLLLMTMALVLAIASGTAMAEIKNGPIFYNWNGIHSIDPTATNPERTYIEEGGSFDISQDRTTIVSTKPTYDGYSSYTNLLYTCPLYGAPCSGAFMVDITNLWCETPDCQNVNRDIVFPRFSPDAKTIYFIGLRVLGPDDDIPGIYSVPTEGGEATKIPINLLNDDGSPMLNSDGSLRGIGSFAVSHDGSKFAINGPDGIFTVPVGGGDATRVSRESCGDALSPSFSRDDQMIVYTSSINSGDNCSGTGHQTIYTTPANNDGTSPGTPLFPEDATDISTSSTSRKWFPTYSPDGKYIAFSNTRDGTTKLATAPATGGTITNVDYCGYCVPLWIEKLPDATITSSPSPVSSPTVSFAFSSDESDATFECRLDEEPFESCSSPKQYTGLSYGSHTFEVRAVNGSGTDPTPASYTWTVDRVPDTTIDSGPSGYVRSTSASFSFTSSEPGSTFQCSRDGSAFAGCTSPKSYSSLSQGNHTFRVRAINTAGKPDPYPASRSWFVDTVVPKGTIAINGKDVSTRNQSVTLYLSASDPSPASGVVSVSFRNAITDPWSEWFDYSSIMPWQLSNGAGTKTVYAQFKDRAGNVSATAYDRIKYIP
jgi:hypothetical protein